MRPLPLCPMPGGVRPPQHLPGLHRVGHAKGEAARARDVPQKKRFSGAGCGGASSPHGLAHADYSAHRVVSFRQALERSAWIATKIALAIGGRIHILADANRGLDLADPVRGRQQEPPLDMIYRRLPGKRRTLGGNSTLWIASDHLLLVKST